MMAYWFFAKQKYTFPRKKLLSRIGRRRILYRQLCGDSYVVGDLIFRERNCVFAKERAFSRKKVQFYERYCVLWKKACFCERKRVFAKEIWALLKEWWQLRRDRSKLSETLFGGNASWPTRGTWQLEKSPDSRFCDAHQIFRPLRVNYQSGGRWLVEGCWTVSVGRWTCTLFHAGSSSKVRALR